MSAPGREGDELVDYEAELRSGPVGQDLKRVRNVKPAWSSRGLWGGLALGGLDMWTASLLRFNLLGTRKHRKTDAAATGKAKDFKPIDYPRPDGKISFDRLTNVAFSFTNDEESQPCHLKLKDPTIPIRVNLPEYAEPAQRYCPAAVYEVVEDAGGPRFVINFQNCVHCKTCGIKDPTQNIVWTTPRAETGRTIRICEHSEERGAMNELNGYDAEDLTEGMSATFAKAITEAGIVLFTGEAPDSPAPNHRPPHHPRPTDVEVARA